MVALLYKNTSDNRVISKNITLIKEVSIELKSNVDFISPTIFLQTFNGCEDVNYLYIEEFKRYYFVNNINHLTGCRISLSCSVDVLMSNKDNILSLSCIIDKQENASSNFSDKYIDDGSFVTECRTFNSIINFPNGFNDNAEFILITAGRSYD